MGIATGTFQQLLQEHRLRPFTGNLLTLGKQDVYLTAEDVQYWTRYYGVQAADVSAPELAAKPEFAANRYLEDRTLFAYLGVHAESLDASPYEGCDHVADLNAPEPPDHLRDRYDLVVDAGTLEHVFHLPNALRFCHALLKDGGRMIHMSPASNFVDHGFYMMSPTLFHDYYTANGWSVQQMRIIRHTRDHDVGPYWALDYSPDHFFHLSFGGLGEGLYQTFVVAEKAKGATASRMPQQRIYRERIWHSSAGSGRQVSMGDAIAVRIRERLAHYSKWIDALQTTQGGLVVAIFGAGAHTSILLQVWRDLDLPEPKCVFQSTPPVADEFGGIRLVGIDEVKHEPAPHLIVLSSRRFEADMADIVARVFPAVPTVHFWS
jgi:SAM-dependent methyltransferase